ncbi:MAG TPA: ABC transporter ATP-binding protein [Kosmotogaceae bacterium]|nr:ABC transporter ATP-binding protein [Kosmotogaceae bacterium]
MTSDVLISVRELKRYYGATKAVDNVSFDVFCGEILAILGPNGAGKTTTVEIMEGLRTHDNGTVQFFDEKLKPGDTRVKEVIGVQLQTTSFMDHLTVRETIELFGGLYKNRVPADEVLNIVSLEEKAKTYTKHLSGGQKQRLAIATALVNDPQIIFLDEPTTGLDPQARRMLWGTIEDLRRTDKTIILTTHYMEEAERLADRILIFDQGRIVASGTLDQLVALAGADNVVEFTTKNRNQEDSLDLTGFPGLEKLGEDSYAVTTQRVEETLAKLFKLEGAQHFEIENIVIRKPNLEDVFLTVTGHSLRD